MAGNPHCDFCWGTGLYHGQGAPCPTCPPPEDKTETNLRKSAGLPPAEPKAPPEAGRGEEYLTVKGKDFIDWSELTETIEKLLDLKASPAQRRILESVFPMTFVFRDGTRPFFCNW